MMLYILDNSVDVIDLQMSGQATLSLSYYVESEAGSFGIMFTFCPGEFSFEL